MNQSSSRTDKTTSADATASEKSAAQSQAMAGRNAQCLISFGSNLGDRHDLIAEAAKRIAASSLIDSTKDGLRTSRLFQTPPIGGPGGQDPFLNAIGAFDTNASAREVLDLLQQLETDLGRLRKRRWDARSIDLDVVLHGELVGGGTGLIVPHPRYTARQFVLQPACDVASHYRDPRFGWTLQRLAEHVSAGSASLSLVGGDLQTRQELCRRLTDEHNVRTFAAGAMAQPMAIVGNAPAQVRPVAPTADQEVDLEPDLNKNAGEPICVAENEAWVSAYLPSLPEMNHSSANSISVPRLVARIQRTSAETRWPAPHQMWPAGWRWPEYRLEVDDIDWAVSEIVSALESMRCPVEPVTEDGDWWG